MASFDYTAIIDGDYAMHLKVTAEKRRDKCATQRWYKARVKVDIPNPVDEEYFVDLFPLIKEDINQTPALRDSRIIWLGYRVSHGHK